MMQPSCDVIMFCHFSLFFSPRSNVCVSVGLFLCVFSVCVSVRVSVCSPREKRFVLLRRVEPMKEEPGGFGICISYELFI